MRHLHSKQTRWQHTCLRWLWPILFLLCSATAPVPQLAVASDIAPQDIPTALVPSGVDGFALASPKLFWFNYIPPCPPFLAQQGTGPAATYTETISRIPAYGGLRRDLYQHSADCGE